MNTMNKSSKTQHHRTRTGGKSYKKWKSKSRQKDEKSIMQAEVKSYKERSQAVQDKEGKSVTKNRLTIHQGIYGHGSTSGTVCREIGFTKEGKARAEANLSRIINLARTGSALDENTKVVAPSVTPERSFVLKDKTDEQEKKMNMSKDAESDGGKDINSPKSDQLSLNMSQSSVHHSSSQGSYCKRARERSHERSDELARKRTNSGSKCENLTQPKKTSRAETEDLPLTTKKSESDDEEAQCEILTVAIMKSLNKAAKDIGEVKKLSAVKVKKMHNIRKNGFDMGKQTQTTHIISAAIHKLGASHGQGESKDRQNHEHNRQNMDEVLLQTPSSSDYLEAKYSSESRRLAQNSDTVCKGHGGLDVTLQPEKTIISPMALLKQYENKLETLNPSTVSKQSLIVKERCSEPEKIIIENNACRTEETQYVHRDGREHKIPHIYSGVRTPKYKRPSLEPQCLKTVVVNPLNFLERYEQQSKDQVTKDNSANASCKSSSRDCYFQLASGEDQHLRLVDNATASVGRSEYLRNENMRKYYPKETEGRRERYTAETEAQVGPNCRHCLMDIDNGMPGKENYFETNLASGYPRDAYASQISNSRTVCQPTTSGSVTSCASYPDNSFLKFNTRDGSSWSAVRTQPHLDDVLHHHLPSQRQDIYNLYKPSSSSTVYPENNEMCSSTTQPRRTLLSPLHGCIQGNRLPACVHNGPFSCREDVCSAQIEPQHPNRDTNKHHNQSLPCHTAGFNFSCRHHCCNADESSSQGSSQTSNSQELRHWPWSHLTGREKSSSCTMDWVDARRPPVACQAYYNENNQIPRRSAFNSPELHERNYKSPERWFYRRKLY